MAVPVPIRISWIFEERASGFSGLAADTTTESALDVGDSSEVILAEAVSYNYAAVLEVRPVLGRWFAAGDERAAGFTAVISYRTWQSRFGGDPQVIGKQYGVWQTQAWCHGLASAS